MCFSWSVEGGWFVLYLKRVLLLLYLWLKGHWTTTITMLWNKKLSGMFVVGYNHVLKSDYVGNSFKIIRNALTLIRKVAFEIGVIFCLFCCFLENLIFKRIFYIWKVKYFVYNQNHCGILRVELKRFGWVIPADFKWQASDSFNEDNGKWWQLLGQFWPNYNVGNIFCKIGNLSQIAMVSFSQKIVSAGSTNFFKRPFRFRHDLFGKILSMFAAT